MLFRSLDIIARKLKKLLNIPGRYYSRSVISTKNIYFSRSFVVIIFYYTYTILPLVLANLSRLESLLVPESESESELITALDTLPSIERGSLLFESIRGSELPFFLRYVP